MSSSEVPEKRRKRSAGRNLPAAILVAAGLFIWIFSGLLWSPWIFVSFWSTALLAGSWEVLRALDKLGMRGERVPILVGIPFSVAAGYGFSVWQDSGNGLVAVFAVLLLTTLFALFGHLHRGAENFVKDASASFFVIGYLGILGAPAGLLLAQHDGGLRLLFLFACVPANDTGAYLFGSLFGKHKLAPRISPGKTWEGLIGGMACSAIAGAALAVWLVDAQWHIGVIIGLALGLTATLGDLVESMVKRNTGLKDMSGLLPGHGGAMDRLDSLLASAPVLWLLMYVLL